MALDRQRILSELGSVMNQLQNADCGCMGKLFNGPGQGQIQGSPLPTCGGCRRGSCCGHGMGMSNMGMGRGAGGDPYSMSGGGGGMGQTCMGRCNPPKLYADTYGYLNQNLMRPVMNEVYQDLKSISPDNAVGNSPMAAQMGLSPGSGGQMGGHNPGNSMGHQMAGGVMENPDAMVHGLPASQMMGGGGQRMMGGGQPMMGGGQPMMGGGQTMMGGGQSMMGEGQSMVGGNEMGIRNGMDQPGGNQMAGMGAQIMNMMMSGGGSKPLNPNMQGQGGQLTDQMIIDAPNSPHGQVGLSPVMPTPGGNQEQFGVAQMGMSYTGQSLGGPGGPQQSGNSGMAGFADPQTQYVSSDQVFTADTQSSPMNPSPATEGMTSKPNDGGMAGQAMGGNMAGQAMDGNIAGKPMGGSMTGQQMGGNVNRTPHITGNVTMPGGTGPMGNNLAGGQYGQHTAGMKKFSEMFPGFIGGDLGFDPMAIAIQMNPANQKRAAMDTITKLMGGKQLQKQPEVPGANAANAQLGKQLPPEHITGQLAPSQQQPIYQQQIPVQQALSTTGQPLYQQSMSAFPQPGQAKQITSMAGQPGQPMYQQGQVTASHQALAPTGQAGQPMYQGQQQQVYSATDAPTMNQQQIQPSEQGHEDPNAQYQEGTDPNAELPAEIEGQPPPQQMMYREPIFPAERKFPKSLPTSHKYAAYYNTLGQPVELLPASLYRKPEEPNTPQSLSWPDPNQPARLRNDRMGVKQTMSKTSITGNTPLGNTPSRSQMQHYYRQIKGAQGHKPLPIIPPNQTSASAGKINQAASHSPDRRIPIEKVGGDTISNNHRTKEQAMLNVQTPHGDIKKEPVTSSVEKKQRNGLQDLNMNHRYMTNAWTFHGAHDGPVRPMRNAGTATIPFRTRSPSIGRVY